MWPNMINPFEIGAIKEFSHVVSENDLAEFAEGRVHNVYATFALGRDAEWCCRLFVLEMKEHHEEGIGTFLSINNISPALLNQTVRFVATLTAVDKNEIICTYQAFVEKRLVAEGEQKQKIVKKEKLNQLFETL